MATLYLFSHLLLDCSALQHCPMRLGQPSLESRCRHQALESGLAVGELGTVFPGQQKEKPPAEAEIGGRERRGE